MNRHSIATVSLSGSLDEKIAAIAAAGFGGLEIFENDFLVQSAGPAAVRRMIEDQGLVCTCFQPFRDLEGMTGARRRQTFDRLERKLDLMEELGAGLLLVCSNVSPHSDGDPERIAADLFEAAERAGARGLKIGYEALAWGRHVNDHREAWAAVERAGHPALGLILDSFHSLARNVPTSSIAGMDPVRIFLVQIADAPLMRMDELFWSRHFRNMPGQGDLPVLDYVAALEAIGYGGPYSLEIFNDRFRAGSPAEIALDGRRSLLNLDDRLARRSGKATMAPPVPVAGVEFVEFAASEKEAEELAGLFAAMGFRPTGRHLEKAVTLWSQGAIKLVINSEPASFAQSYDVAHGASVCAIGLRVDDSGAAVARARALQIPIFEASHAEIQHAFPAVRGVGGSLIYLVDHAGADAVWGEQFAQSAFPDDAARLTGFDHVSQVMLHDEMLTWLLFYTAFLDVSKSDAIESPDLSGLVETQAISSADGGLRLLLNSSIAPRTLARRFLDRHFGSGTQSLSFRCDDIFAAVDTLRSAGVSLLEISPNYYDDLAARFGLEEAFIERLRERNLLYDRDGSGEYIQGFTRAFHRRFFFGLVQRGDYAGYGLANEGVRLAAQGLHRKEEWI